ncbi:MAG: hypothetical protein WBB28_20030 [Crinalium sp.]
MWIPTQLHPTYCDNDGDERSLLNLICLSSFSDWQGSVVRSKPSET